MNEEMQQIIEKVMNQVQKNKVQSLCKKILKKCSVHSKNDLGNVSDLAVWLYIYEYYDEAIEVCNLIEDVPFTGNYTIWNEIDCTMCIKARIFRERGQMEAHDAVIRKVNEHRQPELYVNLVDWYRNTLNVNIASEEKYSPKTRAWGWRLTKIRRAIQQREAGGDVIPDEEYEADIQEIIDILRELK